MYYFIKFSGALQDDYEVVFMDSNDLSNGKGGVIHAIRTKRGGSKIVSAYHILHNSIKSVNYVRQV